MVSGNLGVHASALPAAAFVGARAEPSPDRPLTAPVPQQPGISSEQSPGAPRDDRGVDVALPVEYDLFRATLDAVPDAVVIVDAAGVIVTANVQVEAVFGYRPEELEGQAMEILVPPRVRERHPRRRAGYTQRPMGLLQLSAVRRDGEEFPAEISLAPLSGSSGRLTAATVRNISDRLRLEAEADRMRDELLATVTHELRTPLTSIIGYAELLGDLGEDQLGAEARPMLEAVERNARRELRLVTDLLALAVGNLGELKLSLRSTDLADVVREVLAASHPQADEQGIELELRLPDEATPRLDLDRDRMLQVVDNLVSNALKFTPSGGRVLVELRVLTESVVVIVRDNGHGIEPADVDHVFDRMYRGRHATRHVVPGAGLGLAMVKSFVEAHRGSVKLSSTPGRGTVVTVQLPLH